ncbi:hypothetical protein K469DRAFT_610207 [Zopfia rhizophila CBS 207.26]|uniref:U3 small nucleolar RNA-associated protein 6 N-terminal domain-containing protein n=1 Tax=Zopfia rhizophila CBS 207.26 TaxID=1314779 RepID=A0A6A6DC97_9PEZI|nr:hypothetical protein K469DRAFT_610207 [Zopfia rhizophila CBS 207.26]
MTNPSDKARFYLEQSVEELNELERKKIFTKDEINSIAKRRSDFEHIINARGSNPSDYARYIEYEKNLDALRRKRIKRLGAKPTGGGQKRIFFLYNRGTRKFSGDLGLWMQYIEFARKEKAFKKLNEMFTSLVRLHPTKPELWIYAAEYFMDTQADITNARSYMQRGLRFCKSSETLWLEYAKLEAMYIGKIAGRRKTLGLDIGHTNEVAGTDGDMIALPAITAEDVNPSMGKEDGVDEIALQNLASAPVLTGAIPIAVFDAAMKQFQEDPAVAEQFFKMFAEFEQLPCLGRILRHILDYLKEKSPQAVQAALCAFHIQLLGVPSTSPDFPSALRNSLDLMNKTMENHPELKGGLSESVIRKLLPLLRKSEDLEPLLRKALSSTLRKYCRLLEEAEGGTISSGDAIVDLIESLQRDGKREDSQLLIGASAKQWGENERLRQLQISINT